MQKQQTPGYKAVLISEASFLALQKLQKSSGKPIRLSVADLADAAIALQIGNPVDLMRKAQECLIASLTKSHESAKNVETPKV